MGNKFSLKILMTLDYVYLAPELCFIVKISIFFFFSNNDANLTAGLTLYHLIICIILTFYLNVITVAIYVCIYGWMGEWR